MSGALRPSLAHDEEVDVPGRLAVDRMTERGLYKRLRECLVDLDPSRQLATKGERQRRAEAWMEARELVNEIELRGVQLRFPDADV